ncbi:MAG: hypothetical protein R3B70_32900 [Polyangiaceae bacterium]
MKIHHAAVWLDHSEARVFHIEKKGFDETHVQADKPHQHLHRKSGPGAVSGKRAHVDPDYYEDICKSLGAADEILILGPSTAKLELIKHVHKKHPDLTDRVVGVETVDHPSAGQIVAYARKYFDKVDNGS